MKISICTKHVMRGSDGMQSHMPLCVTLPNTVTPRAAPRAWGGSVCDMWGSGHGLQSLTGPLLSSCQLKVTWETGCPKTGGM